MLDKQVLTNIMQKCFQVNANKQNEKEEFLNSYGNTIQNIWQTIASDSEVDTDIQLLYLRIAFLSLQLCYDNQENLTQVLISLIGKEDENLNLPGVTDNIKIKNLKSFHLAMCCGIVNVFPLLKNFDESHILRTLLSNIYENAATPSRYQWNYYQVLIQFVKNHIEQLNNRNLQKLFYLSCDNLEKRDGNCLFNSLLNKLNSDDLKEVFNLLMKRTSWLHKYKYVMLNEILKVSPRLLSESDNDDISDALVYAQSRTYLLPSSSKLYSTILASSEHNWLTYYSKFEKTVINSKKPLLVQQNIFKYFMPIFFSIHCDKFDEIISNVIKTPETSLYTIIQFLHIGYKSNILKTYQFDDYIFDGLNHRNETVRSTSFAVLCLQDHISKRRNVLTKIKYFLINNIDTLKQSSREIIKKSLDKFLKKIQLLLITSDCPENKNILLDFLNWLVKFLFNSFTKSNNYQRITLAKLLLEIVLKYFTKTNIETKDKNYKKILELINNTPSISCIPQLCFSRGSDIIICCDDFIHILLKQLPSCNISEKEICEIEKLGKCYILSSNFRKAEIGKQLFEVVFSFLQATNETKCKKQIEFLFEMMFSQWNELKFDDSKDVVANDNPLHPCISLCITLVHLYTEDQIVQLLDFIEEVVDNILHVFIQRAMMPHETQTCLGVALVFKDQSSEYHACTVNCTWLVLKECCVLSAKICKHTKSSAHISRSINLITAVIKRCYHKGALETAGSVLGEIISDMTTEKYNLDVIDNYLKRIFNELPKTMIILSTVRRSAETRMILSSIANNDKRNNKTFYHNIMIQLMEILETTVHEDDHSQSFLHALILHCIVPMVINNKMEISSYVEKLLELCFVSFKSENWNIRNAALQVFGSLIPVLLGSSISHNDEEIQRRVVSVEEVFNKYPMLCETIIRELKTPNKDVIIPMLILISYSYSRGPEFSDHSVNNQINSLKSNLKSFIYKCHDYYLCELSAKAYASLCNCSDVQEIECIITKLKTSDNNFQFKVNMLLLQTFADKIFECPLVTYPDKNQFYLIQQYIDAYLQSLNHKTISLRTCSCSSLLKHSSFISWQLDVNDYKLLLKQVCDNKNIIFELPGVWDYLEKCFVHILSFIDEIEFIHLFKFCLTLNTPLHFKCVMLETLDKACNVEKFCIDHLSQFLINDIFRFIHDDENLKITKLIEIGKQIFFKFNILHIQDDLFNEIKIIESYSEINDVHLPIYCYIFLHSPETQVTNFFLYCAKKCNGYLNKISENLSVLKCIEYILEFSINTYNYFLRLLCVKLIYQMLQCENDLYQQYGCDLASKCVHCTTHPYMSIVKILNKDFLIEFLRKQYALQFLIFIFCDTPENISLSLNPFDTDNIETMNKNDLDNILWKNICAIIETMPVNEKAQLFLWFDNFKNCVPDSENLNTIEVLFNMTLLGL